MLYHSEFIKDVKEHLEPYDPDLSVAMDRIYQVDDELEGDELEEHLGVKKDSNVALRRLITSYNSSGG